MTPDAPLAHPTHHTLTMTSKQPPVTVAGDGCVGAYQGLWPIGNHVPVVVGPAARSGATCHQVRETVPEAVNSARQAMRGPH